jgi:hypothetical protein
MCLVTPSFCQCTFTIPLMTIICPVMTLKVLVLPMLFIAFQTYVQSHSCSPPKLSSVFVAWFSDLHLILYVGGA